MGNDDLLSLISSELTKDAESEQPAASDRLRILYFGVDKEVQDMIKKALGAKYEIVLVEEFKEIPKLLNTVNAILLDPSSSTVKLGISLTKKIKQDFTNIKVLHVIRGITHEYGVFMNNFPFQNPDYAAEVDQLENLIDFVEANL